LKLALSPDAVVEPPKPRKQSKEDTQDEGE